MTEQAKLFLVREEHVPVEDLRPGQRLVLARGMYAVVERVDVYETLGMETVENFVVRWKRGRDLGSFRPLLRGETVRVDRG